MRLLLCLDLRFFLVLVRQLCFSNQFVFKDKSCDLFYLFMVSIYKQIYVDGR